MRFSILTLVLACATASPLLCQTEMSDEPVSYQDRELKACGPKDKEVKYVADTDNEKHPMGKPTTENALIYILRPSSPWAGQWIQTKLAVDGEWKGVNMAKHYFFFTLQPGLHYFCSEAGDQSLLVLTAEAGKTYYLEQELRPAGGLRKARNNLAIIDDAEGQKELAKLQPSTWKAK